MLRLPNCNPWPHKFFRHFLAFLKYIPKDFITYLNIMRGTRKQKKICWGCCSSITFNSYNAQKWCKTMGGKKTPRMDKEGRVDYVIYPRWVWSNTTPRGHYHHCAFNPQIQVTRYILVKKNSKGCNFWVGLKCFLKKLYFP